jgi:hypothetical protein
MSSRLMEVGDYAITGPDPVASEAWIVFLEVYKLL